VDGPGNACVRVASGDQPVGELEGRAGFDHDRPETGPSDGVAQRLTIDDQQRSSHAGARDLTRGREHPLVTAFRKYYPPP
jgi:hypothetical protein